MIKTHIYLSHPQVMVEPLKDIRNWSLNAAGRARVADLSKSVGHFGITLVVSSAETKALETAKPLADAIGCRCMAQEKMHENDRSATGFLPPEEFEATADQFFADPDASVRGWETAIAAQARIVREVEATLAAHPNETILFVGHGAVGTLLYCHLAGRAISRQYDQGPGGGGCFFTFSDMTSRPDHGWRPMEQLRPAP